MWKMALDLKGWVGFPCLNAFFTRKIDVLKSDIAKAEEDIEAATALAEAGKAEWAPQLEDLQREVSHSFFFYTTVLLSSFYVSYNHSFVFFPPFSLTSTVSKYSRENVLSK